METRIKNNIQDLTFNAFEEQEEKALEKFSHIQTTKTLKDINEGQMVVFPDSFQL